MQEIQQKIGATAPETEVYIRDEYAAKMQRGNLLGCHIYLRMMVVAAETKPLVLQKWVNSVTDL